MIDILSVPQLSVVCFLLREVNSDKVHVALCRRFVNIWRNDDTIPRRSTSLDHYWSNYSSSSFRNRSEFEINDDFAIWCNLSITFCAYRRFSRERRSWSLWLHHQNSRRLEKTNSAKYISDRTNLSDERDKIHRCLNTVSAEVDVDRWWSWWWWCWKPKVPIYSNLYWNIILFK